MKRQTNRFPSFLLVLVLAIMAGCGRGGPSNPVAGNENVYNPGEPVNAVRYSEAATITLLRDDGNGLVQIYKDVGNGLLPIFDPNSTLQHPRNVVPGDALVTLGVKVEGGTTDENGMPIKGRVFFSNGASDDAAYQVEAKLVETSKNPPSYIYACEYHMPSSDNLLVPILVQIIYPNGYASKEKFVLRTFAGASRVYNLALEGVLGATDLITDKLVRDGLDVMVGSEILKSAKGLELSGILIESLIPAKAPGRENGCVLYLEGQMGNLPIKVNLGIDDGIGNMGTTAEVLPNLFLLLGGTLPMEMGITQMSLAEMLGGLAGDFGADMSGLKLDSKPLFIDVHGLPDATTDDVATLDLGLFMAPNPPKNIDPDTKAVNEEQPWLFPTQDNSKDLAGADNVSVSVYPNNTDTHPKKILTPADVEILLGNDVAEQAKSLGANLSMDNLSQFVSTLLDGSVTVDAAKLPIPLAIPNYSGNPGPAVEQKMNISFNKEGIAFDFRFGTPMLTLNDMRMEYLENGAPKWQMSLDMTFALDVGSHNITLGRDPVTGEEGDEQSFLDIYLTLIPARAHCHVMKDNLGIGIFDHSTFVVSLVEKLGEMLPTLPLPIPGTVMASINMSDLGFILSNDINIKASAKTDAAGRCFLKMVTKEADLKEAGLCFIDTASTK